MAGNANSGRPPLPATVHMLRGDPSKQGMAALQAAARARLSRWRLRPSLIS